MRFSFCNCGRVDMMISKVAISCQVFLNFIAMICFANVASFQANWGVGPSALSGFAVSVSVAGLLVSLFLSFLQPPLTGVGAVIFTALVTGTYLLTALLTTVSAFTQPGCISPYRDPHAQEKGAHFRSGLSGWCIAKKTGAISFLLAFALWAVALVAIYIQRSKDRPASTREVVDPPQTEQLQQVQPLNQQHLSHPIALPSTPLRYPGQIYEGNQSRHPRKQREFDEEDGRFPAVQLHLVGAQRSTFNCGVCLETYAVEDITRVDSCAHAFCRECIRSYIISKLKERHFPIFCPTCMTEKSIQYPIVISNLLAQQAGISKEEYDVWTDLEMAAVSINIHCPKCKRTVFVDRQEYEATNTITCPLTNCNHRWCKTCRHDVPIGGAKHSCDGSAELDDLVKHQGWKYCPGCKTPIQKYSGCNHMKCISPGCNTHFCYRCGKSILRSIWSGSVDSAVKKHYRDCQMFPEG